MNKLIAQIEKGNHFSRKSHVISTYVLSVMALLPACQLFYSQVFSF